MRRIWFALYLLGTVLASYYAALGATVLLGAGMIKAYDLVVALTNGGPGTASELPAKFVMDYLFVRQNIGLAAAASTVLPSGVISTDVIRPSEPKPCATMSDCTSPS